MGGRGPSLPFLICPWGQGVGMGARPRLETHFLKCTEGWEGVGTGGVGGLVSLKLNVLISGGRY